MSTTYNESTVQPYLFFDGRCDEAIEFYKKALGAQVQMLMRYKENPDVQSAGCMPPDSDEKVMHASLRIGNATVFVSDGRCTGTPKFDGFGLSLSAKDIAESERYFAALSEGGQVIMPLSKTFYSPSFGMVADKFGVHWMVIVPTPMPTK